MSHSFASSRPENGSLWTDLSSLAFPIVWLCWGQTYNNLISQAGQMETYGIPNDVMPNFNPIACIIAGPLIQQCLFPFLNRCKIPFRPIARISVGFFLMGASLAWATGLQAFIYRAGPCPDYPLACPDPKNGTIPQHISVFLQVPCYVLMAIGEIFCVIRDDWVRVLLFASPKEHEVYRAGLICGNGFDQLCIGHCDLAGCKIS
ncbi:Major facilitator superfamily domain general substrate transporter [Penicillium cf. viridicatum]|uniref:Major facilitator superfamily domain general substrate transporter n=1 Tax=Penicillium cf. viridicatum TaxID=2972119 RepID=A0A9W9MGT8_9EURO|nr:Major facilitator superfamily domain general substrate transporter [Penicillium cf. viridicatum]